MITSSMSYDGTATRQLMIQWNHQPTFPSMSIHDMGAKCRKKMQGEKERENWTGNGRKYVSHTVQASVIMTISIRRTNKYLMYRARSSSTRQE